MINLPFLKNSDIPAQIPTMDSSYLAIDIGTELLKVILFKMDKRGVWVERVARIEQQQHAMSKGVILNLSTVIENCNLAISELTNDLKPEDMPSYAVLGLAGESVQGVSIIVNYEREERYDSEVTEEEQKSIVSKVHEQIAESGKADLAARIALAEEDIEILHITLTGMEIGGMNVDSLVGFRGRAVKLMFYASFAPKTYLDSLRSVVGELKMNMLGVVAQPFAVARAFAGARNRDFDGIFVDIGGGTTDVAVVKNGNVVDTQMFGFGGRVFTKELARAFNLDYRHAEDRKIKFSNRVLDKSLMNEVHSVIWPTAVTWMKALKIALEEAEELDVLPPHIYLSGGGALLPEIKKVMLEFPWTKMLPFASIPKVEFFLPTKIYELHDRSGELNALYDITPSALARFAYDKVRNPENYYMTV